MYIKQWAAALLLGAIVLGTASCAKDEPKKPETSVAIEDLAGTWNLSGATFSPETVTVGGTEYKVADHIFKAFIFGGLNATPSKVKIEDGKATLISVVGGAEKTFDLGLKDGKLSFQSFSLGSVVREGNQLKLEIAVENALLKRMPLDHFANSEAGVILKAIADQNLDLKIKLRVRSSPLLPATSNYVARPPLQHLLGRWPSCDYLIPLRSAIA